MKAVFILHWNLGGRVYNRLSHEWIVISRSKGVLRKMHAPFLVQRMQIQTGNREGNQSTEIVRMNCRRSKSNFKVESSDSEQQVDKQHTDRPR